jgi:hypothetical protein
MSPDEKDPPLEVQEVLRDDFRVIFDHDVIDRRRLRERGRVWVDDDRAWKADSDSGGDDVPHEDHGA